MSRITQPELPIDPPAEPENDPYLTDMIGNAHQYRNQLQGIGINLAEAGLLDEDEDCEWEHGFEIFERLLEAATGRVADVSRQRREAAAHDDD